MAWSPTRVSPAPCSAWLTGRPAGASPQTLEADGARSDGLLSGEALCGGGPLPGGTANRGLVIRLGDTVLRPTAPCWRATHALLPLLGAAAGRPGHRRRPAGPRAGEVPYLRSRQRADPGRAPSSGRGRRPQPRLDLRDRHRGRRSRAPGIRRPLALGGGTGRPGAALVPAAPARPAGRGALTVTLSPPGRRAPRPARRAPHPASGPGPRRHRTART